MDVRLTEGGCNCRRRGGRRLGKFEPLIAEEVVLLAMQMDVSAAAAAAAASAAAAISIKAPAPVRAPHAVHIIRGGFYFVNEVAAVCTTLKC